MRQGELGAFHLVGIIIVLFTILQLMVLRDLNNETTRVSDQSTKLEQAYRSLENRLVTLEKRDNEYRTEAGKYKLQQAMGFHFDLSELIGRLDSLKAEDQRKLSHELAVLFGEDENTPLKDLIMKLAKNDTSARSPIQ